MKMTTTDRKTPSRLQIMMVLGAATLIGACGSAPKPMANAAKAAGITPAAAPAATPAASMTDKSGDNGKGSNAGYY